ncbi:PilZ domain-containing protein [Sphingomicrobium clamense]|uniref:PilZ domain-containing protein n=1 Tax=Sphingomicrobium clamense TaxID=2851013 RepID=A0ABS6V7E0_9SPHN|nr:PilZ domain-containing protein [Sphingomicrobium sp. B8]MBW0145443.1 PilZ domain-containing protein [Sphingomicrobium sp. B8]
MNAENHDFRREPGQVKRQPRVRVEHEGVLIDSEGAEVAVKVADISREGCRLFTDGNVMIGERVTLKVGRAGAVPAQVRWALGNEAGLRFIEAQGHVD